jgi:hypothetical protein
MKFSSGLLASTFDIPYSIPDAADGSNGAAGLARESMPCASLLPPIA